MNKEIVRIIEEARKLSDSEWESLKAKLLESDEVELEKKVYNVLNEIGIPSNMRGYRYLTRAIILSYNNPSLLDNVVTKELYPQIAKEFKSTWTRVERGMRYAIEIAFSEGDMDKINEVFKYAYSPEKSKATNTQFIAGIVSYIRNS